MLWARRSELLDKLHLLKGLTAGLFVGSHRKMCRHLLVL
jgi:hypothetical protein